MYFSKESSHRGNVSKEHDHTNTKTLREGTRGEEDVSRIWKAGKTEEAC